MYINYINYHIDLAFTLFSSVILTKIWHFDISNCNTPLKNWSKHPAATIRGNTVFGPVCRIGSFVWPCFADLRTKRQNFTNLGDRMNLLRDCVASK